ncbi:peptidoglycan DD-metalloendopeptidase family protein [Rhodococcus hoagii]|nr:peptidoglycan DD-metalloendopeptidase family protein [Prescottella equi]
MLIMVTAVVVIFSDEEDCDPASGDGGSIAAAGSLVKPTKSNETTDTSGFGARWGTEHKGIDRAGPVGTPIYAFTDGRVVESGPASGFGNWIVIDHEIDGKVYSTVYGHMFDDGLMVKAGDHVRAGQQIAVIGNAGQSTGAHLHFEVWDGGRLPDGVGNAVNPQSWIDQASEPGETTAPSTPPVGEDGGGFGGFNNRQMAIAKQIVAVGEVMGVPDQGAIVALATASQESGFRMYANDGTDPRLQPDQKDVSRSLEFPHDAVGRDHGSVNQFQQQYPWWGTLEELMDSATASRKFFEALLKIPAGNRCPSPSPHRACRTRCTRTTTPTTSRLPASCMPSSKGPARTSPPPNWHRSPRVGRSQSLTAAVPRAETPCPVPARVAEAALPATSDAP